ncbi:MAG: signal peptidase I [Bacteroidota bacterium]
MEKKKTTCGRQSSTPKAKPKKSFLRDMLEVIIPAVLIFLVVRTFFFESRWVPSPSMVPTIEERDRFLENKLVYRFRTPRRGEIVVFHPPAAALVGSVRKDDFVKRVIGLPGETIDIRDGRVYINGKLLPEPYVPEDEMDYLDFGPFSVPEGHLFMLGDNRRQSRDSRYWGYLPLKNVDGKAMWRFWPLNRISILR